jgi:hypothetical protein
MPPDDRMKESISITQSCENFRQSKKIKINVIIHMFL